MGDLIRLHELVAEGFGSSVDDLARQLAGQVELDTIGFRCVTGDLAAEMFAAREQQWAVERERERQRLEDEKAKAAEAKAQAAARRAALKARADRQRALVDRGLSAADVMLADAEQVDGDMEVRSYRDKAANFEGGERFRREAHGDA
ncbi:hypothetical protein ABQE93_20885 [Mycolicibacterium sp. XJ662]